MAKKRIIAFSKQRDSIYLIVEKDKFFFDWLSTILFKSFKLSDVSKCEYTDKKGNYISKEKNIKDFVDKHESYIGLSDNAPVDNFYGLARAVIIVNASKKSKEKFMGVLEKHTKWKK